CLDRNGRGTCRGGQGQGAGLLRAGAAWGRFELCAGDAASDEFPEDAASLRDLAKSAFAVSQEQSEFARLFAAHHNVGVTIVVEVGKSQPGRLKIQLVGGAQDGAPRRAAGRARISARRV